MRVLDGGRAQVFEIASQRLQREFFTVDFAPGPDSHSTENRKRWTPALNRVLEQKTGDEQRYRKPLFIHCQTQKCAGESQGRGVGLKPSLDAPFPFQFFDATGNDRNWLARIVPDVFFDLAIDLLGASGEVFLRTRSVSLDALAFIISQILS